MNKHTPGPWEIIIHNFMRWSIECSDGIVGEVTFSEYDDDQDVDARMRANARLIAAAPTQHEEMIRYLPIIERAEADPELWERLTSGTGIATANAYRAAIVKAIGESA
jgi:hypothetical protein